MISLTDKIEILKKTEIFGVISENHLESIAKRMGEKQFEAGEILFKEGEQSNSLFIVVGGKIKIFSQGIELATMYPGHLFGEMSAITDKERTASAQAKEKTQTLFLKRDALHYLIYEVPEISLGLMHVLIQRLEKSNSLLLKNDASEVELSHVIKSSEKAFKKTDTEIAPVSKEESEEFIDTPKIEEKATRNTIRCPNCFEYNDEKINTCVYCQSSLEKYKGLRSLLVAIVCALLVVSSVQGYIWLASFRSPLQKDAKRSSMIVRALKTKFEDISMTVEGFGRVRPVRTVSLISQAKGRVIEVHENFKSGSFIKKGQLLVRLDPRDYELQLRNSRAKVMSQEAKLKLFYEKQKNIVKEINLARNSLKLAKDKRERSEAMFRKKALSKDLLVLERQSYLDILNQLIKLENIQNLLPAQIEESEALLQISQVELEQTEQRKSYTYIVAPFDARVKESTVTVGSTVQINSLLAQLEDYRSVEIPMIISQDQLRNIFVNDDDINKLQQKKISIKAEVMYVVGGQEFYWQGNVVRIESFNSNSGTVPVVIAVDNPSKKGQPPLQNGSFVQVKIVGRKIKDAIVIPRSILHENNTVYVERKGRLEIVIVKIKHYIGDNLVIEEGVSTSEMIILTNIPFPIDGMPLRIVEEKQ